MKVRSFEVLVAGALTAGCAGPSTTAQVHVREVAPERVHAAKAPETVQVLLDQPPGRPFRVAAMLHTTTPSNVDSIEAMRHRAAQQGLDGIYWIDCTTPCSGRCTARGFVYIDPE